MLRRGRGECVIFPNPHPNGDYSCHYHIRAGGNKDGSMILYANIERSLSITGKKIMKMFMIIKMYLRHSCQSDYLLHKSDQSQNRRENNMYI